MRWNLLLRNIDPDARIFGLGYLILLPLYLAPLLVVRFPPGLDLPFHLAMVDMLNKAAEPSSPYAPYYQGGFAMAPYAAYYLALRFLSIALPLMVAHKVVVALYLVTFPLATAQLLDAGGRSRIPALLAFPLAYNLTLHYGFVSFAFSLPVVMALLACLGRFLVADRMKVWLVIATAFFAVLLFLFHLQNFLYGVCAGLAFLVFADAGWRRRLLGLGAFAPALALLVRWHVSHEYAGPAGRNSLDHVWELLRARRRLEIGTRGWIDDFIERLEFLPLHLLRGFTDSVDVIVAHALVLVLAGYLLLGAVGLLAPPGTAPRPRLRVAGWIAFAGALLAYLVVPHHLPEFELMTFHPRFSVLAMTTALLVIPASLRRLSGASRGFLLLPALTVSFYYAAELFTHYRFYDKEVADFDAVVAKTPAGGRAVGLVFDRQSRVMRNESALVGLPSLYPVLRPSATGMVPIFYCGMRHMPCRRLTPEKPMPELSPWAPYSLQPESAIDFFEYFFVRLPPARPIFGTALDRLELIASEGSWLVYRRKPGPPPTPAAIPTTATKARRERPRRAVSPR